MTTTQRQFLLAFSLLGMFALLYPRDIGLLNSFLLGVSFMGVSVAIIPNERKKP